MSSRAEAVRDAFGTCLADLARRGVTGCACQLGAVDDMVLLPREGTAYARGTSARLKAPALGIDGLFVAEETSDGALVLRGTDGPFALVDFPEDRRARLVLAGEPRTVFAGDAIAVGFRRGRLARRLYLQDATGRRITLLVGFSPAELDQYAAGWLLHPGSSGTQLSAGSAGAEDG
ncbi:MAG: hypothetical protein AAGG47_05580 [Pseudomonadota bacterium]